MSVEIVSYTRDHVQAVQELNVRLKAAGIAMRFPESETPAWLPRLTDRKIFQEYYLAAEAGAIRGGYILKHQEFTINGEIASIGNYQLPLSEGIIDKRYGFVGLTLLSDALRRQPLLYSLGIGGYEESLAQLLKGMGWRLVTVPFFFRVCNPTGFLAQYPILAAFSGSMFLV